MKEIEEKTEIYARSPGVELREMSGSGFLADPDSDRIYYLNETGTAIWNCLATPTSMNEVVAILRTAFPDAPGAEIEEDVKNAFAKLRRKRLIRQVPPTG